VVKKYSLFSGAFVVKTKSAFTLVELTVAVAILALIISFSGVVFKVSINSQRLASANAEIMQKYRAITDQLNSDLKGLCKDAPLFIWFELDPNTYKRYDQIMFFSEGDFTSTRLYSFDNFYNAKVPSAVGQPVRGNTARIYYGQADLIDYLNYFAPQPVKPYWEFQTLARRCHILTVEPTLIANPNQRLIRFPDISDIAGSFVPFFDDFRGNNINEHDSLTLSEWKAKLLDRNYNDRLVTTCFDNYIGRPKLDTTDSRTLHMLLADGVGSFSIQWAYPFDIVNPPPAPTIRQWRWWPDVEPDNDPFYPNPPASDSDFDKMILDHGLAGYGFGIYFKAAGVPNSVALPWFSPGNALNVYIGSFPPNFFPKVLKFTFTIYDSKGIIKNGRTFTHIVYLDD